eukprot:scaffold20432_cov70-Phaeocystis_antarctica.AAC.2
MYKNSRGAEACVLYYSYYRGPHSAKSGSAARATHAVSGREHMHARRACRTAFGATAAKSFSCVLRNSLGTWNVPNLLCRAKTLWSCTEGGNRVTKGGNRVTGEGWSRLFRLFVDRLFRHHEPDALLLRVLERGEV